MPSEYCTVSFCPGHCAAVWAGTSTSDAGNVTGSLPDGLTSPNSSEASALPYSWPGYQHSTMPRTAPAHGIVTAEPLLTTTTVFGLAAATSATSWFCAAGRLMSPRSLPSLSNLPTNTTARFAARAAATAWSCACGPPDTVQFWALVLLQVKIWSWVPLAGLAAGTSRHLPEAGLTRVPLLTLHFCAPVPLQS